MKTNSEMNYLKQISKKKKFSFGNVSFDAQFWPDLSDYYDTFQGSFREFESADKFRIDFCKDNEIPLSPKEKEKHEEAKQILRKENRFYDPGIRLIDEPNFKKSKNGNILEIQCGSIDYALAFAAGFGLSHGVDPSHFDQIRKKYSLVPVGVHILLITADNFCYVGTRETELNVTRLHEWEVTAAGYIHREKHRLPFIQGGLMPCATKAMLDELIEERHVPTPINISPENIRIYGITRDMKVGHTNIVGIYDASDLRSSDLDSIFVDRERFNKIFFNPENIAVEVTSKKYVPCSALTLVLACIDKYHLKATEEAFYKVMA